VLFEVVSTQPSERWTWKMRNASMWPLKGSAMPLTCRPMPRGAELRSKGSVSLSLYETAGNATPMTAGLPGRVTPSAW
jgi:hypothetical protein